MISRISILVFGLSCLFISLPSAASETVSSLGEKGSQSFGESVVIGLIGDSTVAVQSGWGPAFTKRFDNRVKIVNYAKNGATLKSLSLRLDELVEHNPDYVLIQFGHNDQKRYDPSVYSDRLRSYVEPVSYTHLTLPTIYSV